MISYCSIIWPTVTLSYCWYFQTTPYFDTYATSYLSSYHFLVFEFNLNLTSTPHVKHRPTLSLSHCHSHPHCPPPPDSATFPFSVLLAFPLSHVSLPFPPLHYVESPSSSMPTDTPPLITSSFSHTIHICIILLSCPTHIIHSSSVRRCCVVSYRNLLCLTWCENKIHDRVNCSTYC